MRMRFCSYGLRAALVALAVPAAAIGSPDDDGGLIQLALVMDLSHGSRYRSGALDADVLSAATRAFTESRRFDVIERANLQSLLAEKDLEDFIQKTNAGGLVDLEGVDMIGVLSYDIERAATATYYRISVQLTSTKTGRVDSTITSDREAFDEPTSVFIAGQHLYQNIKEKFPASGWVIETRGERVVIDLGERDGIAKGDRIEVFTEGEPIIHPVTGELMDGSETRLAILKVTDVHTQMATCAIKGDGVVQVGDRVRLDEKDTRGRGVMGRFFRKHRKKLPWN